MKWVETLFCVPCQVFGHMANYSKCPLFPKPRKGTSKKSNYSTVENTLSLVYADKPQTLDHLEGNIRRVIADLRPQMLEKVIENWTSRLDYIRASRGCPMPEIIFKIQNETHQEQLSEYLLNLDAKQIELQTLNKEVENLLSDNELFEAEIEGSLEYEENINKVRYKIKVVEFHRQKDSKIIGDVRELMKFVKFEIESRESADIALGHSQKIPENSRYPPRNSSTTTT
ncbi:uncharacterized protein TNCV_3944711 [Trichonephila clavipes]|nr:uncharacterized protein TNCV_3944711 [Trichonephila clavipes]